jgi:Flp pilus assembly protein TadG
MRHSSNLFKFLSRRAGRLKRDTRANVAITFALTAVPLIALVGLGIDYYRKLSYQSRLNSAADSAAIAAIQTIKAYINANTPGQSGSALVAAAENAGTAQAIKVFNANAGASAPGASATPTVTYPPTSGPLFIDAQVSYSGQVRASFGGLVGVNTLAIAGSSQAAMQLGAFQDIYLVLDTSASMGVPTDSTEQSTFASVNPDSKYFQDPANPTPFYYQNGCMFACHYGLSSGDTPPPLLVPGFASFSSSNGYQGFNYAEANNITLRIDSLASAVWNLVNYAPSTAMFNNQYRFGVYPFINHAVQAVQLDYLSNNQGQLSALFEPPSGSTNQTAFATTYIDSGTGGAIGSGGTHFENLWTDMQQYLQGSGTGTSSSPQGVIFLVTDGADNGQTFNQYAALGAGFSGSTPQTPPTSPTLADLCQSAKNLNYTVAVLLIPYVDIPAKLMNNQSPGNEDVNAMGIAGYSPPTSPSPIEARMQACATGGANGGLYAEASTDAEISAQMQNLFNRALQKVRLTQ